jgi:hypothetical protein
MADFQSQIDLSLLSSTSLTSIFFSHCLLNRKRFLWSGPTISCKWLSRITSPKAYHESRIIRCPKIVIDLRDSRDRLFVCSMLVFLVSKLLWPLALYLAHLSYLVVDPQYSLEARSEGPDARWTSYVIVNDNWRPSSTTWKQKMKPWYSYFSHPNSCDETPTRKLKMKPQYSYDL